MAFYWSPMGDEARYDDGLRSDDADGAAYLAFVEHPTVEPQLRPFDLGSSEGEAQHWLVLDREDRTSARRGRRMAAALPQAAANLTMSLPSEPFWLRWSFGTQLPGSCSLPIMAMPRMSPITT